MKCIEDEIPFELPEGWEWTRIGTAFQTVTGNTPSTKDSSLDGADYPFYKPNDLDSGFYVYEASDMVSLKGYQVSRQLPECSVLVTCIGATIGKTGFIRKAGICNQQINAIIPNGFCNPEFTFFYMCSGYEQGEIISHASATTLPILNKGRFDSLLYVLPPLNEQNRITARINELLSWVDSIEKDELSLQELVGIVRRRILDLAIRGKLVLQCPGDEPASVLLDRIRNEKESLIKQGKNKRNKKESSIFRGDDNSYYDHCIDDEIPFDLPDGWMWARGRTCFSGMETRKPTGTAFEYIDIDAIDNHAHAITKPKHTPVQDAPSRASRAVQTGSVLFSMVRPYLQNIALVPKEYSACIASTGFYVCNSTGLLAPEYMYFLMLSPYVVDGLNQFMKGDNSPSIGKDDIENWLYPIPPIAEQERIASMIKEILHEISEIDSSLS